MNNSPISIQVETQFMDAQSNPEQGQYVFAYTITIANNAQQSVQLLTREWSINDADGKVTQVAGDGVVGKQPHIKPGEHFTYTSGTVLTTPLGSMQGSYGMLWENGDDIEVPIPAFRLAVPNILH